MKWLLTFLFFSPPNQPWKAGWLCLPDIQNPTSSYHLHCYHDGLLKDLPTFTLTVHSSQCSSQSWPVLSCLFSKPLHGAPTVLTESNPPSGPRPYSTGAPLSRFPASSALPPGLHTVAAHSSHTPALGVCSGSVRKLFTHHLCG